MTIPQSNDTMSMPSSSLPDHTERHYLLHTLNATRTDYPQDRGLHELFEEQAQATPQHTALVFGEQQLSYEALNAQANQLTRVLRAQGVVPGSLVGLYLERGIPLMVAVLAILKAGGAYLPLDPAYPEARLRYMLENSGLRLILSQATLQQQASRLAGHCTGVRVLGLDSPPLVSACIGQDVGNLARLPDQSPSDLAYVIYTSGSTGRPKGVMIEHRGAVNLARYQQRLFGVDAHSRVICFASFSFDAATSEWLMALLKGAALYICADDERRDPAALETYLLDHGITHATLPPALLAHMSPARPYRLQSLILAGEACPWQLVQPWLARWRVFNAYGPTETTVCASAVQLQAGQPITIGPGMDNVQLYVLDEARRLLPRGAAGELYIGGDGLARGYLNRPDLTAERFVDNPFHTAGDAVHGPRLYRSGDLVRRLDDGNLEYLGRIDDQVKIRGFRIELGEIESQLCRHDAVASAHVQARQDGNGEQQLVAYFTASAPVSRGAGLRSALKAHLEAALPAYMLPAFYIELDVFPLTPNGKIDKAALPAPDPALLQGDHIAPATDTERQLAAVWARLLNIDAGLIGTGANFFALGGHSLTLIRLGAAIGQQFGKALRPADVFAAPELGALARKIDTLPADAPGAIPSVGGQASYAVSSKQKMDWMSNQISQAKGFPALCCQLSMELPGIDAACMDQALGLLVDRHEILRTQLRVLDGDLRQVICDTPAGAILGVPHDLSTAQDADAALAAIRREENARSFDFANPPLYSAQLVRMPQRDCLLFTVDHVCGDQQFFDQFLRELHQVYDALLAGRVPALPPVRLDYKSYAQWEHEQLHGAAGQAHHDYWHGLLGREPYPCFSRYFADHQQHVVASYRAAIAQQIAELGPDLDPLFYRDVYGAVVNAYPAPQQSASYLFTIDAGLLAALQASAAQSSAWLSSVMTAGLHILLHKLSGRERVLLGLVAEGRDRDALLDLGGCLINDIFSVSQFAPGMTGAGLITLIQQQMQESAAHKIYPFARLLSELDVSLDALGLLELNYVSVDGDLPAFESGHRDGGFGAMDLNLAMTAYRNGVQVECNYKRALFEPGTVETLMRYFVEILRHLARAPDSEIALIAAPPGRPATLVAAAIEQVQRDGLTDAGVALARLQNALASAGGTASQADARLSAVLRQAGDLMADGVTLFSTARSELDSAMRSTLVLERVARTEQGWRKTVLKAGPGAQTPDPRACAHSDRAPAMLLYHHPITLPADATLQPEELPDFYQQRQQIVDGIAAAGVAERRRPAAPWRAALRDNRSEILRLFEALQADPAQPAAPVCRRSHPPMQAILHVLPRLVVAGGGDSVLAVISRSLAHLRDMGFATLMLGCVDPQSVDIHYGEDDSGQLHTYVNNHGYWSSGANGIDAALGKPDDYIALVRQAAEHGILLMQDTVLASLGYPAQLAHLARTELAEPTHCLRLGQHEVSVCDADRFLHAPCVPEEESLDDQVSAQLYADVIAQSHSGSLYALPKPNLFDAEVLAAVLERPLWQIRSAGVSAFRIDMAKHIGLRQLQAIITTLRSAHAAAPQADASFTVLLEYWTTRYRDLKFAMLAVAPCSQGVYFYDFPLAQALQDILIKDGDVGDTLGHLLEQRARWGIPLYQMIPTFIDHDFSFRPIYNGDSTTRATVVVGYALAAMLSANAPYVYFAYDKSASGLHDDGQFSRTPVAEIFASSDHLSPADPIAALFRALEQHPIFKHDAEGSMQVSGDVYSATLTRSYADPDTATLTTVEAHFSRFYQPDPDPADTSVIFAYCHGPSIVMRMTERAL